MGGSVRGGSGGIKVRRSRRSSWRTHNKHSKVTAHRPTTSHPSFLCITAHPWRREKEEGNCHNASPSKHVNGRETADDGVRSDTKEEKIVLGDLEIGLGPRIWDATRLSLKHTLFYGTKWPQQLEGTTTLKLGQNSAHSEGNVTADQQHCGEDFIQLHVTKNPNYSFNPIFTCKDVMYINARSKCYLIELCTDTILLPGVSVMGHDGHLHVDLYESKVFPNRNTGDRR